MRFLVLGPLEVAGVDGPIRLGGPKQRAVLAHLLVRPNQVVPAESLIDHLWGEEPPETARNTLQTYVSHLRKALGAERLEGRAPGYVLHVQPDELDAARFEALVREARAADGQPDRVRDLLDEALRLWRGPAFADLVADGLAGEIARLDELRAQATEERFAADLESGRHVEIVGELESLTREFPLRERLWSLLMLALYRSGRQADALAAFQRARETLADELGVDPSPDLQRLHERILRQDDDLEVQGEPLRGYRLLEKIGEGAFGAVYRAIQPHVGREVAVKSIHPDLANQPDFVRRFEREAQLVAQLEHPRVVPLYDYWREPDAAYLIMRFLRGGTLEDLLEVGPLDVDRAARVLDHTAAALGAAHRQGIVHRDVKPANVLLDEEGNAYLSDFGVALGAGSIEQTTGTMIRGTPAYLSPEQILLEPITPRSDIYSLGIVLYEMLTGEHPFEGSTLRGLLDQHLEQSLPSVRRIRSELAADGGRGDRARDGEGSGRAIRGRRRARDRVPGGGGGDRACARGHRRGPEPVQGAPRLPRGGRRGLLRSRDARPAARRPDGRACPGARFLCLVGPSGSGKSSVVRAGLVPALRRGAIPGSEHWFVVELVPGAHPMRQLESALLGIAVDPPPSLLEELEGDELGLVRAVDRVLPDPNADLLIVLDQLEEVFTLVDDDAERSRLLDALRAAAEAPGSRVRIVATLRADFFDQPLSVRGFGELLADHTEAITPMSPEQLERAIAGPAEHVGLRPEPGLVAAMVTEVVDRPGALPLLQYALTELTERAEGGTLTLEDYRRIGGVSGALARRAEQLFEQVNETGREACRQLFLRLVALGEGTEDTRRRVRRSELESLAGSLSEARALDGVIETFGRHRLLSFDRDADTREPTVEIAHEALLREWSRFRDWIEEAREGLRLTARISAATAEWSQADRTEDYLLSGTRLAQAEEVAQDDAIRLTEDEREYVEASLTRRDAELESERARHERELQLERRSRTRLRSLVAVLAVASLLAASLTVVSVNRSREAERQRAESTIAGLTGESLSTLNTDPELSVLLALHAISLSDSLGVPVPAETVDALHYAMQEAGVEYPVADGQTVLAAGPLGIRGIFDLPLSELANSARTGITRSLRVPECERFLGSSTCPTLPSTFPADLAAEPVDPTSTLGVQPLFGTQVTLFGGFNADVVAALRAEMETFTGRTGIEVRLVGNPAFFDYVPDSLEAGDPPDVAFFPQPGEIVSLGRDGNLIDIGTYMDIPALKQDQSPYLVSLGTIGEGGTWPASEGATYGAFANLSLKSMIWHPVPELRASGYAIPRSWDELIELSDRLVDDGRLPWCLGWKSRGTSGWPGTDWIEHLLLKEAGPVVYDQWASHEIPFDSPPVRQAFEHLGQILFAEGYLADGAIGRSFEVAQRPMVKDDPPGCWLYQFPGFASSFVPEGSVGVSTDIFPFPSIGRPSPGVVGGGDMIGVFSDRPEVRELVRYLLGPTYGQSLATSTPFISPHREFDMANYRPFERSQAELINDALASDAFRFDASDLMPPPIGNDLFWGAMMRYAEEGPESLDAILAELDAAWPDDG